MFDDRARAEIAGRLAEIRPPGTFKEERVIQTPQGVRLKVPGAV